MGQAGPLLVTLDHSSLWNQDRDSEMSLLGALINQGRECLLNKDKEVCLYSQTLTCGS